MKPNHIRSTGWKLGFALLVLLVVGLGVYLVSKQKSSADAVTPGTTYNTLPYGLARASVVWTKEGTQAYIIGGFKKGDDSRAIFEYNLYTGAVTQIGQIPTSAGSIATVYNPTSKTIYIFRDLHDDIIEFNPQTKTSAYINKLSNVSCATGTPHGDRGGTAMWDGDHNLAYAMFGKCLYQYNPQIQQSKTYSLSNDASPLFNRLRGVYNPVIHKISLFDINTGAKADIDPITQQDFTGLSSLVVPDSNCALCKLDEASAFWNDKTKSVLFLGVSKNGVASSDIIEYIPGKDGYTRHTETLPYGLRDWRGAVNPVTQRIFLFGGLSGTDTFSNRIIEYAPVPSAIVK